MHFALKSFSSENMDDSLYSQILKALENTGKENKDSVKIAMSDANDNSARGVVIYEDSANWATLPIYPRLGDGWIVAAKFNDNDGFDSMFNNCLNYLNNDYCPLTDLQRFYSRIAMSNLKGGASHLTLFAPKLSKKRGE